MSRKWTEQENVHMNREILFRGLHRRKGEKVYLDGTPVGSMWVYGGVCQFNEERAIIYQTEPEITKFPVYAETVGQYTGFTDENGVMIFEGDIVKCYSREDVANCVVIFEEGEFHLVPVKRYKDYQECCGYHAIRCFTKIVIGNVYDNPELLGTETTK